VRPAPALPDVLDGAVRVGPFSTARPGAVLRVVPGLGRFLATGGDTIEYVIEPGGDTAAAEPLLQGPLTAALIHQRGELPLHAAVLAPPGGGRAIALAGDSGAGKSTLAYALVRRGWTMLAEDLARLRPVEGALVACPGRVGVRLCPDACRRFGIDPDALPALPGEDAKRLVPTPPPPGPTPLAAVLLLDRGGGDGVERLAAGAAAAAVYDQTHRVAYVAPLGMAAVHWSLISRLVARCTVARFRSGAPPETAARMVETFSKRLSREENSV
jgi:hypothetical protein